MLIYLFLPIESCNKAILLSSRLDGTNFSLRDEHRREVRAEG